MKTIHLFLIFFLALTSYKSMAGGPANARSCVIKTWSASSDSLDHIRYQRSQEHWRKMKLNGVILTSVGGGLFLTGQACMWTSVARDINTNVSSSQDKLWVSGALLTVAAVGLIIPGAIMLARGTKRYRGLRRSHPDPAFDGLKL
jgi:hypothetical protein